MINHVGHGIKERHIMGYEDKGVLVVRQIIFEPVDVLHIEVVGRLVQDEDFRILQQKFCEQDFRALAAGEFIDLLVQADIPKAQAAGYFLNAGINGIVTARFEHILNIAHIPHQCIHFLRRGIAHLVVGGEHFLLGLHHIVKGGAQGVANGHAGL